ncbi:MAG: extracellular solute-binding protein [Deltaproteobacteria bacterium]|nr:extracellular solute-binding protein [Deltaproteobacteria bacterium]
MWALIPGGKAVAAEKELTILVWSHFIPDVDKVLKKHAEEFGKLKGVKVRVDTIDLAQFAAKKAAEAQAKSGHDIIQNYGADAFVYKDLLAPVDDVVKDLSGKYGGHIGLAAETCQVEGKWKAVPWYYYPYPLCARIDLIEEIGEKPPDTWDDFLRIAKKLKAKGKPAGIQLGHSRDGNAVLLALLWSYGASVTAADGQTVTINSPETAKAMAYVKELFKDGMSPDVVSWDDGANNRAFLAGTCSMTFNSPSIYKAAVSKKIKVAETGKPMADALDYFVPPKGPKGRFAFADALSLGVWNFSKNQELAKEFIKFHFEKAQFDQFLEVAVGYNVPFFETYRKHSVFTSDPKIRFIGEIGRYEHTLGYPGPVNAPAQVVWDLYVINNMFAYAATGKKSIQEAIEWGEKEIKDIYAGKKKK